MIININLIHQVIFEGLYKSIENIWGIITNRRQYFGDIKKGHTLRKKLKKKKKIFFLDNYFKNKFNL